MQRILIQLDTDRHPSVFDRVVAIDAGVDQLFSYGGVTVEDVQGLIHGGMFTRKPAELKNTAVFIGGNDVAAGEALLQEVGRTFFGPIRLSVMMDSNGSNTTAAAAVVAIGRHLELTSVQALIPGGTGPVGMRVAQILASQGATVRLASRTLKKAREAIEHLSRFVDVSRLSPCEFTTDTGAAAATTGVNVIVSAGAAGVPLLSAAQWQALPSLQVLIDLNAVPPLGVEGVDVLDKARDRNGVVCYGAIGVGGTKMKIHLAAIQQLFEANDKKLETAAIYEIGRKIG